MASPFSFFCNKPVADTSSGVAQDYRVRRMTKPTDNEQIGCDTDGVKEEKPWKPPARNTIHNEVVTLRMVLKTAHRHGWIEQVPDLSDPYRRRSKIEHRPWFTPNEYKQLYEATRENAAKPKSERYRWRSEQLHDFVLLMANTGLWPDEVKQLQFRDAEIVDDNYSGKRILKIEVRGKLGTGYCKSMLGAVALYGCSHADDWRHPHADGKVQDGEGPEQVVMRKPLSTDLVFPNEFKKVFNRVLTDSKLKFNRSGKARTAYSLRHSYICFRLLEGADIYQVAKNCRTSVEMIEKHYAAHLKDMIDTLLVNVRRERSRRPDSDANI